MDNNFATELLHEVRRQSLRWFVAFIIMVIVEIITVGVFVWYISLPVEDIKVESSSTGNANYIGNDIYGGLYNGENQSDTESSTEQKR